MVGTVAVNITLYVSFLDSLFEASYNVIPVQGVSLAEILIRENSVCAVWAEMLCFLAAVAGKGSQSSNDLNVLTLLP